MKYYLSIIFLIIASNHAFTQNVKDTLYLDENNDFISKLKFEQKINSTIYYGLTFDLEDAVYKKIRFAYFFGKMDSIKKQQLFKYLSARNGVDTTKIMAIHYSDTLRAKYKFPKKDSIVYTNDKKSHRHFPPYKTFIRRHKACTKNFKNKKNANVYHYYTVNLGHPKTYKKLSWHKDHRKVLKSTFRDKYKVFRNYIIKPNGEYLINIYSRNGRSFSYSDLFKEKKWDEAKERFYKSFTVLNPGKEGVDLDLMK